MFFRLCFWELEIAAIPEVIIHGVMGRQEGGEFVLGVISNFVEHLSARI